MVVSEEINNFYALRDMVWGNAIYTMDNIEDAHLEEEFMDLLEEVFWEHIPSKTELNDFIAFDDEYIYECLGLGRDGQPIEDTEDEEDEE